MIYLAALAFFVVVGIANLLMEDGQEAWSAYLGAIVIVIFVGVGGWALLDSSNDTSTSSGSIEVKYRSDRVPVGSDRFEQLGLLSDRTVKNAWYDASEKYLVIRLTDTNYHYCEVPKSVWDGLKNTRSPYAYYQDALRGNYDCRTRHLPAY